MLQLATALIITITRYTITDGDTLRSGDVRIRLWGIDAPEPEEAGGPEALAALSAITGGQPLSCETVNEDRYGAVSWPGASCQTGATLRARWWQQGMQGIGRSIRAVTTRAADRIAHHLSFTARETAWRSIAKWSNLKPPSIQARS